MTRLLRILVRDAEQRAARITAREPLDEPHVSAVLQTSVVFGTADEVVHRLWRATERSAAWTSARAAMARWNRLPWMRQRFTLGATLLVAVGVHLSLTAWQGQGPGWLWLILPGIAATVGVLLIIASRVREEPG